MAEKPSYMVDFERIIDTFDPDGSAIIDGFIAAEEVITQGYEQNFYNQVDEDGVPWAPRKELLPHPMLIKTGRMFRAATDKANPEHFSDISEAVLETGIGDPVFYAGFHHNGTRIMPARRVIYCTPETVNRAIEAFADKLEELMFDDD